MIKLSAVIITYNEEKNIERCIRSLQPVVDEVVVLDSFSTDQTTTLARSLGAKVFQQPFDGFTKQKNSAVEKASHDYVLALDADEYLSEELTQSIVSIKTKWSHDGYTFNRLNNYNGRWIKSCGWYPDAKIRLWDRRKGKWQGGLLHEVVQMQANATITHLRGDLMHMAFANAGELIAKIQSYSAIYAEEHAFRKRPSTAGIIVKTIAAFFKNYFVKRGFADGYEGFIVAASNANGVLYKYAKIKERHQSLRISLIITTYNRSDALELVLRSVLQQRVMPHEVIIADDGSREDTRALINEYRSKFIIPLVHVWHEDTGFRLAAIRNKALAQVSGEYIVMIDGDIVLPPSFIADHSRFARKGFFVQGSRVLLSEKATRQSIDEKKLTFHVFSPGVKNRKNAIGSSLLSKMFSYTNSNVYRVRGANMAFWKNDVEQVNGFNEDFVGWGREDSEFVVRLQHAGIKKLHMKFAGYGFHLYHPEGSREMLQANQQILDDAISFKKTSCTNGLNNHLRVGV